MQDLGLSPSRPPMTLTEDEDEPLPVYRRSPTPEQQRASSPVTEVTDVSPISTPPLQLSPEFPARSPTPRFLPVEECFPNILADTPAMTAEREQIYLTATIGGTRYNPIIIVDNDSDISSLASGQEFYTPPTSPHRSNQCSECLQRGHY